MNDFLLICNKRDSKVGQFVSIAVPDVGQHLILGDSDYTIDRITWTDKKNADGTLQVVYVDVH